MLAVARLQFIKQKLKDNKVVLVSELSREMQVTEETIRKDLEKLEKQNVLCRVHGGAYLKDGYGTEASVQVRSRIYRAEKELLANLCMDYVGDSGSILLDCSTTAVCIAKALVREQKKLTVITNSLSVALELTGGEDLRVIMLGGTLNRNTNSFYGNITLEELKGYHVDYAFISSAGISLETGLTDHTREESDVRRQMIAQAGTCIYVADSTKLGRSSVYVTGELGDVDILLTDRPASGIDPKLYRELQSRGVEMRACMAEQQQKGQQKR